MSEITFTSDTDMINIMSILTIIFVFSLFVFIYHKDSVYLKDNPHIDAFCQKLSFLIIGYIMILQVGILYHVNYLNYNLSGSESNILITESDETHPLLTMFIMILLVISLVMTCISVIKVNITNNLGQRKLSQEELDSLEYDEYP